MVGCVRRTEDGIEIGLFLRRVSRRRSFRTLISGELGEELFVAFREATVEGGIRFVQFRSVQMEDDSRGLPRMSVSLV